ncbi:dihydrolipoamide acetyltransferase family protein [Amorphoplanes digitatis]|uniref:Dihydrolipoamide acetyltransferase component of pyruvate dehydrogenase complex n=1 Tax=Actinoplanes digitatis TaxID=1868 RepID=A0A7W7I670_9ACTN|nr:dihydrolipoamide acetyltransferase family protein [Actinoplanes digitatis]MBB4767177.1 pyruvate dehydrogenase E2 component (dihydrolipoamide acetyltransferase) [Actinoplanes digitatis]GID95199.1 dihydrolipoamide acetyltransferase component of pyruvate dehydrogenase complex [Actinoplanes digitatis]
MSRIKEFNLPDLGEGLTEGEILTWLVQVGETIELNQPIVEVETAKAAVEIPAKWAGVVTQIFHEAGTTVEVGSPIISIDTQPGAGPIPSAESLAAVEVAPAEGAVEPGLIGGPAPGGRTAVLVGYGPKTAAAKRRPRIGTPTGLTTAAPATPPAAATAVAAPAAPAAVAPAPAPVAAPAPAAPAPASPAARVRPAGPVLAKPPVRKLARDLGVDLSTIAGTGPLGSVTREDVQRTVAAPAEAVAARPASAPAAVFDASREQRIPIKGVRKLTAENMVASAFTAPHVTEFLTVDVTRSMKSLERIKARPEFRDVRISPLLLVAKAVLLAVKRHPMVNSTWSAATNEIIVKDYVNLGIAAATERGLIVPNVKDAGRLTLRELADALNALVQTAKSGKTPPSDMSGGTLSITNVGVFGVDTGTPILPPGEAAILVFGAIRPTPWVHKGKIKIRQVTTLGLSFDHRMVDGELGSKFLRDIGAFLEDPEGALLSWT